MTTGGGHPASFNSTSAPNLEPLDGPQTPSGVSSANGNASGWQNGHLRRMVLADRKAIKLDRAAFLQMLALRDTPEQVVADLVAMFTADESTS